MSNPINLDADVWGPHYWFFLHTIAFSYPDSPNKTLKRKYYDLIQNFPLFIPNQKMGDRFASMLDYYPVTPYLDNRDSFIRWVNFIHNKCNTFIGKEEMPLFESLDVYYNAFLPKPILLTDKFQLQEHIIHILLICSMLLIVYLLWT
jgi:hypothetical protein